MKCHNETLAETTVFSNDFFPTNSNLFKFSRFGLVYLSRTETFWGETLRSGVIRFGAETLRCDVGTPPLFVAALFACTWAARGLTFFM